MKNGIKTLIALIIVACSMFISFNFTPPSELQECNFEDFSASYISLMSNNYTDNEIFNSDYPDNTFSSKRLIIKSYKQLDRMNAVEFAEGYEGLHIFEYATERDTQRAYQYYSSLSCVEYVEADFPIQIDYNENMGIEDTFSFETWGAISIGAEEYSEYLLNTNTDLPEVIVAVLDTGIDTDHPWFENRIVLDKGKNYTSIQSTTQYAFEDLTGHGTHVSGTIVDLTPNNVKILPIKILDDSFNAPTTYYSSIVTAINYVSSLKSDSFNVRAINMSFGWFYQTDTIYSAFEDAIDNAYENGILSIAAAGNDNEDAGNSSPGNISSAITVSAVGQDDYGYYSVAFSNYGNYVDICAPGVSISSASMGGETEEMSGTSMAAPHVSGAVALLASDPIKKYSSPQIEKLLINSATDLGARGYDIYFGEGLVDLSKVHTKNLSPAQFSVENGEYEDEFELSLFSEDVATIYYTTDGTTPSASNGQIYSSPITITKSTLVSAICVNGDLYSKVSFGEYVFDNLDIDNAFTVSNSGQLLKYSGILTKLDIPSIYDGKTISTIYEFAFNNSNVEVINLPNSITNLDWACFAYNRHLKEIYGSPKTIGSYAFLGCTSLNIAELRTVENINGYAFANCYNLTSIYLPKVKTVYDLAFTEDLKTIAIGKNFSGYTGTPIDKATKIYGYSNSTAQTYSSKMGNTFISINELSIKNNLPNSVTVQQCDPLNLEITSTGFMQTYQWYYTNTTIENGVAILDATDTNLYIDTTSLDNSKKYYVVVTDWTGATITSNLCDVTINLPAVTYTIISSSSNNGYISPSGNVIITEGQSKTFTFVPNTGYKVAQVLVDNIDITEDLSNDTYTFTNVNENHTIYVQFEKIKYTITVNQVEHGTISPSTTICEYGSNTTFNIVADVGYHLDYLIIDGSRVNQTTSTYTFDNINKDHSISAHFAPNTNTKYKVLHYLETLDGSGTKINNKNYSLHKTDLNIGTTDTQTSATPQSYTGFSFQAFSQSNISPDGSTTITILYNRNQYTVAIKRLEGIISVTGSGTYRYGEQVNLSAELITGYKFKSWTSSSTIVATSISQSYSFTMPNSNLQFTAEAEIILCNIELEFDITFGTVVLSQSSPIEYGHNLTISITPNTGYKIHSIEINDVNLDKISSTINFDSINKDYIIKITFSKIEYSIDIIHVYDTTTIEEEVIVKHGDNKIISIGQTDGYYIYEISIDNSIISEQEVEKIKANGIVLENITSSHVATILYKKSEYTIFKNILGLGQIILDKDNIHYGDNITCTFTPSLGYQIYSIKVDGELIPIVNSYVFNNVTKNHTIEVEFVKIKYPITIEDVQNGTIKPEDNKHYIPFGESKTYLITPNLGYDIVDVLVDGISIGKVDTYTFTEVSASHTISATFDVKVLNITVTHNENGTVSPNNTLHILYGGNHTLDIIPDDNYGISQITINGIEIDIKSHIVLDNITEDININVTFAKLHIITVMTSLYGSITPTTSVIEGSTQTFSFRPYLGYKIKDVVIDNHSAGCLSEYTFYEVNGPHTISVIFEIQTFKISLKENNNVTLTSEKDLDNVTYDDSLSITLTTNDNSEIVRVYANGKLVKLTNNTITFNNVTEDIELVIETENNNIIPIETILIAFIGLCAFAIFIILLKKVKANK